MSVTALDLVDPPEEPQGQLFQLPAVKITEKRASLASVKGIPMPDDFVALPDQVIRGTFKGDIKGIVPRRSNGTWTLTYEVDVAEVEIITIESV